MSTSSSPVSSPGASRSTTPHIPDVAPSHWNRRNLIIGLVVVAAIAASVLAIANLTDGVNWGVPATATLGSVSIVTLIGLVSWGIYMRRPSKEANDAESLTLETAINEREIDRLSELFARRPGLRREIPGLRLQTEGGEGYNYRGQDGVRVVNGPAVYLGINERDDVTDAFKEHVQPLLRQPLTILTLPRGHEQEQEDSLAILYTETSPDGEVETKLRIQPLSVGASEGLLLMVIGKEVTVPDSGNKQKLVAFS